MSHFWHAHWAEDAFIPKKLQNWQVPRWHAEWPNRHCEPSPIDAHKNGRVTESFKKPKNPWSKYKGTWELPTRIDRKTADRLSRFTEYKKCFWRAEKLRHEKDCAREAKARMEQKISKKEKGNNEVKKEYDVKKEDNEKSDPPQKCQIKTVCVF